MEEERVRISFLRRKNDQKGEGHEVIVPTSNSPPCFVRLSKDYIAALERNGLSGTELPMLPSLKKRSAKEEAVKSASYKEMRSVKKIVLQKMKLNPNKFCMHAPKVGAVCALRKGGTDWEDIRVKVGWKKNSAMPERYAKKAESRMIEIDNTLRF